jgi:hypothetical protein
MSDQHIPADLLARAQVISGLRQLADYLDQHADIPVNEYGWSLMTFTRRDTDDAAGQAEVGQVANILGAQIHDDTASGGHCTATRTFGRITYEFIHVTARSRAVHNAFMSYANAVNPDQDTGTTSPEAA